jgi:uncharacterized Zn finger protein (UPF0148 family)
MAKSSKDLSIELSRRMLSGWTLLADACPLGCNVPLVENKRQKAIECVSCGSHLNRDGDKMVQIGSSKTDSNETKEAQPQATQDAQPKVQDDEDMFEDDKDFPPPLTTEELAQMEERRKRNDKTSKIMGEKLLGGWTMLSDVCPKPDCYQPLMRDPQKQMWCLGCDTMVVRREDFDPTKHTLIPPSGSLPASSGNSGNSGNSLTSSSSLPTSPPTKTPPAAPSSTPSFVPASTPYFAPAASFTPSLTFHTAHSHQINPDNSSQTTTSSSSLPMSQPSQMTGVPMLNTHNAINALQSKLQELTNMLQAACHPEDMRVIFSAMKECGLAITDLRVK